MHPQPFWFKFPWKQSSHLAVLPICCLHVAMPVYQVVWQKEICGRKGLWQDMDPLVSQAVEDSFTNGESHRILEMAVPDLNPSKNGSPVTIKFDFERMVQVAHIERGIRRVFIEAAAAADAATVEVENSNSNANVNEEVTEPT